MIDFKEFKIDNALFECVYNKWCNLVDINNHNKNTFKLFIKDCLIELFKDSNDENKQLHYDLTFNDLFKIYLDFKEKGDIKISLDSTVNHPDWISLDSINNDKLYMILFRKRLYDTSDNKCFKDILWAEFGDMLREINTKLDGITKTNNN